MKRTWHDTHVKVHYLLAWHQYVSELRLESNAFWFIFAWFIFYEYKRKDIIHFKVKNMSKALQCIPYFCYDFRAYNDFETFGIMAAPTWAKVHLLQTTDLKYVTLELAFTNFSSARDSFCATNLSPDWITVHLLLCITLMKHFGCGLWNVVSYLLWTAVFDHRAPQHPNV